MNLNIWFEEIPTGIDGKPLPRDRIDTLEEILLNRFGQDLTIEGVARLKSKKNTVISLELTPKRAETTTIVAKMFIAGRFKNELSILRESWVQGLAVPEVLDARDDVILMSFIPGEPLVDVINQTFNPTLIDRLAEWYYNFHKVHNQIKADPRLRNFIIRYNQIFGVDFEETQQAPWMVDIAGVCASLLDTDPIFDIRKRRLSLQFLDKYLSYIALPRDDSLYAEFISTLADALKQTAHWRNDSTIMKLSEKIRTEGLQVD